MDLSDEISTQSERSSAMDARGVEHAQCASHDGANGVTESDKGQVSMLCLSYFLRFRSG